MTDRRTTISLEVQDKFSQALNNFASGMQGAAEAMKGASTSATKLDEVGRKIDEAGRKSQAMGDKLQTAFGGSSRAVNVFGNAIADAVGATGPMGYALDILIDSGGKAALMFGGMTAAVTLAGAAVQAIIKQQQDMAKAIEESAKKEVALAEAMRQVGSARTAAFAQTNAESVLAANAAKAEEVSKKLVGARMALSEMESQLAALRTAPHTTGESFAQAEADIEKARKKVRELEDQLKSLGNERDNFNRKPLITDEMIGGLREFSTETEKAVGWLEAMNRTVRNPGLKAQIGDMIGSGGAGLMEFSGLDPTKFEAQSRAVGPTWKSSEYDARAKGMASILKQTQSEAFSLYKSLSDGGDTSAKQIAASFTDSFTSIMQAEADLNNNTGLSMIQLQQVFGKAFDGMSQDMVGKLLGVMDAGGAMAQSLISQLYAIAAGGGTAAEQIEAIRAALAGLPTDKYINIHLNYKASGPGGNQQGDEWNFTLEGEAYATRAAYMDKYGDYGRANDAWQADHRSELNQKGVTGPGQANTRTGEVYQYAFGEHSIVTSPRMMLVGERGPERVDITPGTGARGGGGGGSVTVNFNSLVPPNEFEVRQLAAKLKSYMRM